MPELDAVTWITALPHVGPICLSLPWDLGCCPHVNSVTGLTRSYPNPTTS